MYGRLITRKACKSLEYEIYVGIPKQAVKLFFRSYYKLKAFLADNDSIETRKNLAKCKHR